MLGYEYELELQNQWVECSIEGCMRPIHSRKMCSIHYKRWLKYGDPHAKFSNRGSNGKPNPRLVTKETFINSEGYIMVHVGKRYVGEHRLVMMETLQRPLYKGETVHHKDGNRTNNNPDNLELWVKSHPSGQRIEDLVA